VEWKNIVPIQDPHKPRTIAEFKNRQFQYMITQTTIAIERMMITLENRSTQTGSFSTSPFCRLREDLYRAERLDELPLGEVNAWWQDLQEERRLLAAESKSPGFPTGFLWTRNRNEDEISGFRYL